jgi:hypothetical protein
MVGEVIPDIPSKCLEPFTEQCSITSQMTGTFNYYTAVKTSKTSKMSVIQTHTHMQALRQHA